MKHCKVPEGPYTGRMVALHLLRAVGTEPLFHRFENVPFIMLHIE